MKEKISETKKIHLHSEQFDGYLHAECGAGDWKPPSKLYVGADEFTKLPRRKRCKKCTAYWWPRGGDPV
jgi:hypothetical protein